MRVGSRRRIGHIERRARIRAYVYRVAKRRERFDEHAAEHAVCAGDENRAAAQRRQLARPCPRTPRSLTGSGAKVSGSPRIIVAPASLPRARRRRSAV